MRCSPRRCYRSFMALKRRPRCRVGRGCARCRRVSGEPREAGAVSHRAESARCGMGPEHLDVTTATRQGHSCPAMDARRIRTHQRGAESWGDLLGHRSRRVHGSGLAKGAVYGALSISSHLLPLPPASPGMGLLGKWGTARVPSATVLPSRVPGVCSWRRGSCRGGWLSPGRRHPGTRQERRQLLCRGGRNFCPSSFFPLCLAACLPKEKHFMGCSSVCPCLFVPPPPSSQQF